MKIRASTIVGIVIMVVLIAYVVMPIATVFLWAFAEKWTYPALLPTEWGLRYWHTTLARADVLSALRLSLALSVTVTLLSAVICLPAAYAFARMEFVGRRTFMMSFLAINAFPRFGLIVMIATLFLSLRLVGTFWGIVLVQLLNTMLIMIWLPSAAFRGVDRRLEEAARDVGAGPVRTFIRITIPQAAPAIGAAMLLTFVSTFYETEGAWLVGAPKLRTMPMVMLQMITGQIVVQYGAVLSVLLWVPSFIALLFARRVLASNQFAKGFGA